MALPCQMEKPTVGMTEQDRRSPISRRARLCWTLVRPKRAGELCLGLLAVGRRVTDLRSERVTHQTRIALVGRLLFSLGDDVADPLAVGEFTGSQTENVEPWPS